TVTGTDAAGNPFTATTTSTHTVDTAATATITVNDITPDDIVNAAEAGSTIDVTGTVGGDAAPGDTVSFTINGTPYSGTVLAGNTYSIAVDGADLAADTSFDATVTGTDAAGNPFTATTTSTHTVDTSAVATITVNDITADDVVDAAEAGTTIPVTGSVGGDAAVGDDVTFTINGTDYSGKVLAGNTFSIDVAGADLAADTSFDATVAGSDDAGNPFTATTTSTHMVPPSIDLDGDVTGTGYVTNYVEGGSGVSIADSDITITDVDSSNLQSATIILTNAEAGDLLNVGTLPSGITASAYNAATGELTLTGSASLADYQAAIKAIQFENAGSGSDTTRVIEVMVSDGVSSSNVAITTIAVTTIPTVSINDVLVQEPATGTTTLTFTVSIDEALASDLTFDFSTVDISATGGADYQSIGVTQATIAAGDTTATITVTVNSDANQFEGDETLSVDISNFNQAVNFETSAHTTVNGIQGIGTIGANNGAPLAEDDTYLTAENTDLLIDNLLANDTLVDGAEITSFSQGGSGVVVNNGDGTFTYTPSTGFTGTDTFTYTLTDADGETDTATVTVNVSSAANNPPIVSGVPDISYTENGDAAKLLSGISITDADNNNLSSVVVKVDGYLPSQDVLTFLTAGTGVVATTAVVGGVWQLTLSGGDDISDYLTVLSTLEYQNSSDNPSSSPRTVTVEAYDEDFNNLYGSDSGNIAVTPVNDGPDVFDDAVFFVDGSEDNELNIQAPTDPDTDDSLLQITVTGLPGALGTVTLADGTPVAIGDTLTAAQLSSLQFDAGPTDGQATFTYDVFDGELTTSAVTTIQVGSTAADSGTVSESALSGGTGDGTTIVTGNLLDNDAAATNASNIDSINGQTPVGGIITVATAIGTLTVYADDSTPGFSAGDYSYELTQADGSGNDVDEVFNYTFTESGTAFSNSLTVAVIDDVPVANPIAESVPESNEQIFNLVMTLDTSGSMGWSLTNNNAPPAGEPTRLDVAKQAVGSLTSEFFEQSSQVSVTLVSFSTTASMVGTYDNFEDFQSALNALTAVGGTNYVSALDEIEADLAADLATQDPADGVQNISYFVSDGVSSTSPIGGGFKDFVNDNGINSFAIGIGPGLANGSADLDFIHNIDSLQQGGGHADSAIIVADITQLEAELLNTVPTAFGGNITANGSVRNVEFGADGGYVESINMDIDGTNYTFSYDGTAVTVSPSLTGAEFEGTLLTIGNDVAGFDLGVFTFDFSDGSYTLSSPNGNAGEQLVFDYTVVDGDGDTATSTATIDVLDNAPTANDDLHSITAGEVAEGNVINALGTDGGPALGNSFTPFAAQGGGIDTVVDDATITEVSFRGQSFNLDFDSGSIPAGGSSGTLSWSFSVTTDNFGNEIAQVVVVDSNDDSELVFNESGYYKFTPDTFAQQEFSVNTTSQSNVNNADFDISIVSGGSQLQFSGDGVGVQGGNGQLLSQGEEIALAFDAAKLPNGVRNLVLTLDDFQQQYGDQVTVVVSHDTDGDGVVTQSTITYSAQNNSERETLDLSQFSSITAIDVAYTGSGYDTGLYNVSYQPQGSASAGEPEVIGYRLTDSDGQSDTAQLNIHTIENEINGTAADDSIVGGATNDAISGGDGNDVLDGGAGSDVISGGAGDDTLLGGDGRDSLAGGAGNDTLLGGAGGDHLDGGLGDDFIDGGAGDDVAQGGAGSDKIYGGAGADTLRGDAGDDSLFGGSGDDSLLGGKGEDVLSGGQGDDNLMGGDGRDIFVWTNADKGTSTAPAEDVVLDFETGAGGDVLHLADLLQGEESGELSDYLSFQSDGAGGTIVNIDISGDTGTSQQHITLKGVDLTAGGSLTDQDIINDLLSNGNLIVD
ncbi:VCBS, partial [gamma proteobacterium BDW918]